MERSEQLIAGQGNLLKELHELGADVNYRAIEEMMAEERQRLFERLKAERELGSVAIEAIED